MGRRSKQLRHGGQGTSYLALYKVKGAEQYCNMVYVYLHINQNFLNMHGNYKDQIQNNDYLLAKRERKEKWTQKEVLQMYLINQ